MNKKEEKALLEEVMQKSTVEEQAGIAIEEMSELTFVLCKHFLRGVPLTDKMIEEIGDVEIMLHQLKIILEHGGVNIEERLATIKDYKLLRLKERVGRNSL